MHMTVPSKTYSLGFAGASAVKISERLSIAG